MHPHRIFLLILVLVVSLGTTGCKNRTTNNTTKNITKYPPVATTQPKPGDPAPPDACPSCDDLEGEEKEQCEKDREQCERDRDEEGDDPCFPVAKMDDDAGEDDKGDDAEKGDDEVDEGKDDEVPDECKMRRKRRRRWRRRWRRWARRGGPVIILKNPVINVNVYEKGTEPDDKEPAPEDPVIEIADADPDDAHGDGYEEHDGDGLSTTEDQTGGTCDPGDTPCEEALAAVQEKLKALFDANRKLATLKEEAGDFLDQNGDVDCSDLEDDEGDEKSKCEKLRADIEEAREAVSEARKELFEAEKELEFQTPEEGEDDAKVVTASNETGDDGDKDEGDTQET